MGWGLATWAPFRVITTPVVGKPVRFAGGITVTPDRAVAQVGKTGLVCIPSIGLDLDTVLEQLPDDRFPATRRFATSSSARSTSCSSRATRGWKRREVNTSPLPEFDLLQDGHILCGFLHLAVTPPDRLETLLRRRVTAIGWPSGTAATV